MPTYQTTYLKDFLQQQIREAFRAIAGSEPSAPIEIRSPDRPEHGDYSTNIALTSAKTIGTQPRRLAEDLARCLSDSGGAGIDRVDVAGPGFINVFLSPARIHAALNMILSSADRYGTSKRGGGQRIQVEFVSSNPTGPLTVGHGRQAVLGDVLASLHEAIGYCVEREYYFNDEGRQIDLLATSLWVRYREAFGETHSIPEDGYRGDYLKGIAADLREQIGDRFPRFSDDARRFFREQAVTRMTDLIRRDLESLGVRFDHWFSETTLHHRGDIAAALEALREHNGVFEAEGAIWLRAEEHGGTKDSVLIRSDGRPTYLMVDVAYHVDKHRRGYDRVIDVQGADHQVEQMSVKAALRILGYPEAFLQYATHQFVALKEGGEILRMSTRAGRFVTLHDLLADLGKDVVRYFMVSRKPEAHLDFDLDLARSAAADNPATYMQYAHTRISSIFRKADPGERTWAAVDLSPLVLQDELDLVKRLDAFPEVVQIAAETFSPHLLPEYAHGLARSFHAYYDKHRVLTDNKETAEARLALLHGIRIVLRQTLDMLGMDAPEEM